MAIEVGIIGGGVAGVTAALTLGNLGFQVTLFERKKVLISGPPFCHLHAGGNLYREISDAQCVTLLKQSVDFAKLYPLAIDRRPTVIAIPTYDPQEPKELLSRVNLLAQEYQKLVLQDSSNEVLGVPANYYELFTREQLEFLAKEESVQHPTTNEQWLIPFAKSIDFATIKFPVVVVQEYGINLFSVGASSGLALEQMPNVKLLRETEVVEVSKEEGRGFRVVYKGAEGGELSVDYLINACGFKTGVIDDMLGIHQQRMVEFKAAYTALWKQRKELWPEVVFHGQRGTSRGMGQFTPYCNGFVQLHAMTPKITLFDDGLEQSNSNSSYPKLNKHYLDIIEHGWNKEELERRTKRAIGYLGEFIPNFKEAKVGAKPLFGAQQIPGSDPTLRVAEVAFPIKNYARCEIVKVSSVNDMARAIVEDIGSLEATHKAKEIFDIAALQNLTPQAVDSRAEYIATVLGYPKEMSHPCTREL